MKVRQFAAIDIGSNAMRLLINYVYEKDNEVDFVKAQILRMPIRLGHDVFLKGKISKENEKRMIKAMKAYRHTMEVFNTEAYLAYATSAMRDAENGKRIANLIRKEANIDIEIISGKREADIIFTTELKDYVRNNQNYLYVDVGGGSTELTLLMDGKVKAARSFKIGTVRLLHGKIKPNSFKGEMKNWLNDNLKDKNVELIGSGGNINHLYKRSKLSDRKPVHFDYVMKEHELIKSTSIDDRLWDFNMKPDRADVYEHALDIFYHVMLWSKSKAMHVPKIGLADGMIQYLYRKQMHAATTI